MFLCPWKFPGKNTGVGCHFLLQEIFLTQGSNLCFWCLLHRQVDSLPIVPHYFCLTNFNSLSILPTQDTVSAECSRTPLLQIQWSPLLLSCSTSQQSPLSVIYIPLWLFVFSPAIWSLPLGPLCCVFSPFCSPLCHSTQIWFKFSSLH